MRVEETTFYETVERSHYRDDLVEWFEVWKAQVKREGFHGFDAAVDVTISGFGGHRCVEIGLVDIDYSDLEIHLTSVAVIAAEALAAIERDAVYND